jgi:hypothetical protein
MELQSRSYSNLSDLLSLKYGITDIDKSYLNINYNNKTEWIDRYGRTVYLTRPYSKLLHLIEDALTEEIP